MFSPSLMVICVWIATFGSFELSTAFMHPNFDAAGVPNGTYHADEVGLAISGIAALIGSILLGASIYCDESEL